MYYNSCAIHLLKESFQYGIVTLKISFIFALLSTENGGRYTLDGNSELRHGFTSQALLVLFLISTAKSYHEATPSLEKWYTPLFSRMYEMSCERMVSMALAKSPAYVGVPTWS